MTNYRSPPSCYPPLPRRFRILWVWFVEISEDSVIDRIRAQESVDSESTAFFSAPLTLVILYPEIRNPKYDTVCPFYLVPRHYIARKACIAQYTEKEHYCTLSWDRFKYVGNRNWNNFFIVGYFDQKLVVSFRMSSLAMECLLLWIGACSNWLKSANKFVFQLQLDDRYFFLPCRFWFCWVLYQKIKL